MKNRAIMIGNGVNFYGVKEHNKKQEALPTENQNYMPEVPDWETLLMESGIPPEILAMDESYPLMYSLADYKGLLDEEKIANALYKEKGICLPFYQKLFNGTINFKHILSTNMDNWIECYYDSNIIDDDFDIRENLINSVVFDRKTIFLNDTEIKLWKIHGDTLGKNSENNESNNGLVFGYKSYVKNLSELIMIYYENGINHLDFIESDKISDISNVYRGIWKEIDEILSKKNIEIEKPLSGLKIIGTYLIGIKENEFDSNWPMFAWIDVFFTHEIHIIGLGFEFQEMDLWWALSERQRFMKAIDSGKMPKVYYYCRKEDAFNSVNGQKILTNKILAMRHFNVEVIIRNGYDDIYNEFFQNISKD